jgi:spore germination cell wall hydrolase CwlJ-like protein
MTDIEVRAALNDRQVFGLTLYGEARGEKDEGRRAVANVIHNRLLAGRWGKSYRSVCLWPWQFSCWRPVGGPANYAVVMAMGRALLDPAPTVLPASLRACVALADKAMAGELEDSTRGAIYYLTEALYATAPPTWSLKVTRTAQIGAHVFFK